LSQHRFFVTWSKDYLRTNFKVSVRCHSCMLVNDLVVKLKTDN
jgi:hypothetical protein